MDWAIGITMARTNGEVKVESSTGGLEGVRFI